MQDLRTRADNCGIPGVQTPGLEAARGQTRPHPQNTHSSLRQSEYLRKYLCHSTQYASIDWPPCTRKGEAQRQEMQERWESQAWASLLAEFISSLSWVIYGLNGLQNISAKHPFPFFCKKRLNDQPPGLNCFAAYQLFIYGSPKDPSHDVPAHCCCSSPLWDNSSRSIHLLFHPISFHVFPRTTLPQVSV